jgi:hypothetical protein
VALTSGYARAFELAAVLGAVAFAASFIVPSSHPKVAPETPADETFEALVDAKGSALPTLDPVSPASPAVADLRPGTA